MGVLSFQHGPMGPTCHHSSQRWTWAYGSEDLMMKVRQLVKGSSSLPGFSVLSSMMRKYTFAFQVSLGLD
eukprot:6466548-Amphidinium_carterae.2